MCLFICWCLVNSVVVVCICTVMFNYLLFHRWWFGGLVVLLGCLGLLIVLCCILVLC